MFIVPLAMSLVPTALLSSAPLFPTNRLEVLSVPALFCAMLNAPPFVLLKVPALMVRMPAPLSQRCTSPGARQSNVTLSDNSASEPENRGLGFGFFPNLTLDHPSWVCKD